MQARFAPIRLKKVLASLPTLDYISSSLIRRRGLQEGKLRREVTGRRMWLNVAGVKV